MIEHSSMQNIHLVVSRAIQPGLSQELFAQLSEFIYDTCGIKMPPTKKTMLEARLMKGSDLLVSNLGEYCNYLFSPEGKPKSLCT